MTERACQFGDQRQLVGIVTTPATARGTGMILVSAGVLPKSGPFRLYTLLARRLAADGITTLRFDLGGIGDSQQGFTSLPLETRTGIELRAAVDHLCEHHALDRIVLGGLCSGADDAFAYAQTDPRVTGVVLLDPFSYRTRGWQWRHAIHRVVRRSLRAVSLYEPSRSAAAPRRLVEYRYLQHAESSGILRALIARGVHVHFIYMGRDNFNHPGQLRDMFPELDLGSRVTVDYLPQMDHTPAFEEDRRTLVATIRDRLVAH